MGRCTKMALATTFLVAGVMGCAATPEVMVLERCAAISRVAVVPFTDGPGSHGLNSGNAVAAFTIERLVQSRRYRLVERGKLRTVLDEQNLQASDLIDPATAARVGKLVGAEAVFAGCVSEYDKDKTIVHVHVIPIVSWRYTVGTTVRLIDVETTDIIYAHSASDSSGKDFTHAGKRAVDKVLEPLLTQTAPAPG